MSTSTAKSEVKSILERAYPIWAKAQVVYQSPSWDGKPESRALAEEIATSHRDCETALVGALADESPLIAAHALITLELMKSDVVNNLPEELLQRRSNITLVTGSFKTSMDLGGLARQIQRNARARLKQS